MIDRKKKTLIGTAVAVVCLGGTALAGVIQYSNPFTTNANLTDLSRVVVPGTGTHCKRALVGGQMQVTIGKSTTECDYRTSIVSASGSDANFDITAKITLSPASALAKKTFLSVGLRESETGTGAGKYRLDVSPAAQRFALRRYDGVQKGAEATVFAQGKRNFIRAGKSNKIRLIVYNSAGQATLIAQINGKVVFTGTDAAPLAGRRTLLSIGRATGSDRGAIGSFDNVVIRSAP